MNSRFSFNANIDCALALLNTAYTQKWMPEALELLNQEKIKALCAMWIILNEKQPTWIHPADLIALERLLKFATPTMFEQIFYLKYCGCKGDIYHLEFLRTLFPLLGKEKWQVSFFQKDCCLTGILGKGKEVKLVYIWDDHHNPVSAAGVYIDVFPPRNAASLETEQFRLLLEDDQEDETKRINRLAKFVRQTLNSVNE